MDTLAQVTRPSSGTPVQRTRLIGWLTFATFLGVFIAGEAPYFPSSLSLIVLAGILLMLFGMIPVAVWLGDREAAAGAGIARAAEWIGIAGMLGGVAGGTLLLEHWMSGNVAQIIQTTSLGAVGVWLVVANALAFRGRLINRVLAVLGIAAGVGWLVPALIMWVEVSVGDPGGATPTLEAIRVSAEFFEIFYLIWAIWLGIWLIRRKHER
ncbi:MAG TPA: DUF4386 family protein [Ktedonobacterales bacterium]|nr:DUF4386 family protein [Ktedonobacterales bacterium]